MIRVLTANCISDDLNDLYKLSIFLLNINKKPYFEGCLLLQADFSINNSFSVDLYARHIKMKITLFITK